MHIFMTGPTGWIGSATVLELVAAGHQVDGLTRSTPAAQRLRELGGSPQAGDLDSLDVIRAAAEQADAVVHLGNKHDFQNVQNTDRTERAVVETLVEVLAGTHRPLLVASVLTGVAPGRFATEQDPSPFQGAGSPCGGSERLTLDAAERGVRAIAIRFAPTVHGQGDPGLFSQLARIAQRSGSAGYVADGGNALAAVHVTDAAALVRLGLERASAGSVLHAVAEPAVPTRAIAEAIGAGVGVPAGSVTPEDAAARFGWLSTFWGMDLRAESALTQEQTGWIRTGPALLDDLRSPDYFRSR